MREDRYHGDISRVEGEDKDDTDEVVDHSVDLIPFTLPHQEAEIIFPNFCESRVFQSEQVQREDSDKPNGEDGDEWFDRWWIHVP